MFNKELLIELIDRSGLSLSAIGREIGITHSTLSFLVRGKSSNPHPDTINSLAKYFGVKAEDLVSDNSIDETLVQGGVYKSGSLGKTLYYLMQRSGVVNSSELHRYTGIAIPTIDRILKNDTESPNLNTLTKLAKFFEISIAQLKGIDQIDSGKIFSLAKESVTTIPLLHTNTVNTWLELESKSCIIKYIKCDLHNLSSRAFALEENITGKSLITYIVDPNVTPHYGDTLVINFSSKIMIVEYFNEANYITTDHQKFSTSVAHTILGVIVQELKQRL